MGLFHLVFLILAESVEMHSNSFTLTWNAMFVIGKYFGPLRLHT